MRPSYSNVNYAVEEYEILYKLFQKFISTANDGQNKHKKWLLSEVNDDILIIQLFGKTLKIEFNMVCHEKDSFLGQITAILMNKDAENPIISKWFDNSGSVRSSLTTDSLRHHLEYGNYLATFVNLAAQCLITKHMSPLELE